MLLRRVLKQTGGGCSALALTSGLLLFLHYPHPAIARWTYCFLFTDLLLVTKPVKKAERTISVAGLRWWWTRLCAGSFGTR